MLQEKLPIIVLTKHVSDDPGDEHEAIDDGDGDEELVGLQLRAEVTLEEGVDVEVRVAGEVIVERGDLRVKVVEERLAEADRGGVVGECGLGCRALVLDEHLGNGRHDTRVIWDLKRKYSTIHLEIVHIDVCRETESTHISRLHKMPCFTHRESGERKSAAINFNSERK